MDDLSNAVIAGSAMRFKSMADGTIRFEIDVEPADAMRALQLFGRPGAPVALAALAIGHAAASDKPLRDDDPPHERTEAPKGGALSQLAGQWCESMDFQDWMESHFPFAWRQARGDAPSMRRADIAAIVIREHCGIESRALLDHDADAAHQFIITIRDPYRNHLAMLERERG